MDLEFSNTRNHTIGALALFKNLLYVASYFMNERLKYEISGYDWSTYQLKERFCRGLNGMVLAVFPTDSHLIFRLYNRGGDALVALDLANGTAKEVFSFPFLQSAFWTLQITKNLLNVFYSDEESLYRVVIDYETSEEIKKVSYHKNGMPPSCSENIVLIPYQESKTVRLHIEDFNSFSEEMV